MIHTRICVRTIRLRNICSHKVLKSTSEFRNDCPLIHSNQNLPACYVSYVCYMSFSSHSPYFHCFNNILSYLIPSFFLRTFLHYYQLLFPKLMSHHVPSIIGYQLLYLLNIRGKAAVSFILICTLRS
jgi:hypothetical protein